MPLTAIAFLVWLLFAASGAAALIYEIVWQQLLQLVIGSSTLSVGVLLGVFMGGMCLGSVCAPRLISPQRHPLRTYALLEVAIAVCGLLLLILMPSVERLYSTFGADGVTGVTLRAIVAALCLLPPTFAMGATLPVIARWLQDGLRDGSLGWFYAGNILGAVGGCVAAGFYLLRLYDMNVATYVAASTNALVAVIAWAISRATKRSSAQATKHLAPSTRQSTQHPAPSTRHLHVTIALSGFCALSAEVVWTRMLGLIFGATVYIFSIILAVFLIGLGVGSAAASALTQRVRPAVALAVCQWLTVIAIFWSAWLLANALPYWPTNASASVASLFNSAILRSFVAIVPGPLLWGASFPFAVAASTSDDDPARVVGRIYAANTVGAIVGALSASLWLVSSIGSGHTQQAMVGAALVSGAVVLWRGSAAFTKGIIGLVGIVGIAVMTALPGLPPLLVAYGRHAAAWAGHERDIIYTGEGLHASIAVSRSADGVLNYHNAGKIQASSEPADMRLQRMLGHLTTLMPHQARSVLVIGCGAGVTAGAVSVDPDVERVTVVEIEPLVPRAAGEYFGAVNHEVLRNPKVHIVTDDARHFLTTTRETFDAITSDPLDPWVKGAATLYTDEFFTTARAHLNPGGVMTLFVQLYESSPDAVKSEVATFFHVFPDGLIFGNTYNGNAFDTVLVGPESPLQIDLEGLDRKLESAAYERVARSLGEIGMYGAYDLFTNYAGRARDLVPWTADGQINRDRNLRLQYLAGLHLNVHQGDSIYHDLLRYRVFPEELFVGSSTTLWGLRQAIEGARE